jgi:hypothetical protein
VVTRRPLPGAMAGLVEAILAAGTEVPAADAVP